MYPLTTRLGAGRRYSPERAWEPLSDDEWAVLSPFLHRAAEREAERRRAAEITAGQALDAPALRERRPAGRPVREPRQRLDAIFWLAAHTLPGRAPPPWAALPARVRQARHRLPPVPPLGQGRASGPSSSKRWPTRTTPASPSSAAWRAGSAAPFAAPGACSAWEAWPWPGASASFRRCAAPPGCCPTPICPNRSFPSSAPPCSAPASTASASSRPASCAVTRSCWPSPPADDPSRAPWHRHERRPCPRHERPRGRRTRRPPAATRGPDPRNRPRHPRQARVRASRAPSRHARGRRHPGHARRHARSASTRRALAAPAPTRGAIARRCRRQAGPPMRHRTPPRPARRQRVLCCRTRAP